MGPGGGAGVRSRREASAPRLGGLALSKQRAESAARLASSAPLALGMLFCAGGLGEVPGGS